MGSPAGALFVVRWGQRSGSDFIKSDAPETTSDCNQVAQEQIPKTLININIMRIHEH
jgi:hypothetical protein